MQFKYFEIEKIILCTLACIQISSTQKPRCSTFAMNFFGSLHEDRAKPFWEIEKESIGMVMHRCFPRCERDQQCVGIEICTMRPDLSRCRGCCEWYVIDKDGGLPRNATEGCKYFELSKDSVESRGTRCTLSANSNLSAVASSTLELTNNNLLSNVLDGIPDCNISNVYSSNFEQNPWLEVTLPGTITIWRIIIYNGVYGIGVGLVNLNVTYSNNGVTDICGFYPGLLSRDGDLVSFYCPPKARATTVKMQIQSKPGQLNFLFSCEVEIYRKG